MKSAEAKKKVTIFGGMGGGAMSQHRAVMSKRRTYEQWDQDIENRAMTIRITQQNQRRKAKSKRRSSEPARKTSFSIFG